MIFLILYENKYYYLYDFYYDEYQKENVQIFNIDEKGIILRYSNKKVFKKYEYLKLLKEN